MSVYDTITLLDDVSREVGNLKRYLRIAIGTVIFGVVMNLLALVLYYLHIVNPSFPVIRVVIGIVGMTLVYKAYQAITRLEKKYKAP